MVSTEMNFDGLVGPTHNYAGLSLGNLASTAHAHVTSNPKQAALQGLKKMRMLGTLGLQQGVLPPHERPNIRYLKRLGFTGSPTKILTKAYKTAPELLSICCSASAMWVANAATVSSSANTLDGKIHITPANLQHQLHRSTESTITARALKAVFQDGHSFCHHDALPSHGIFGDEGAANHMHLCTDIDHAGLEIFVYGKSVADTQQKYPTHYPARQTREASEAVARLHGLDEDSVLFVQQNPDVIDQGVFHNDVIATSHKNLLLCHQDAFVDQHLVYERIKQKATRPENLKIIEISRQELSVTDAVQSYLFNSQIVSLPDGSFILIAPTECCENRHTANVIETILRDTTHPLNRVEFVDLRQSMQNGGGPACLRLRVPLSADEYQALNTGCIITPEKLDTLEAWVNTHYRDRLTLADCCDPYLLQEIQTALDALTQILNLGSLYDFQRD